MATSIETFRLEMRNLSRSISDVNWETEEKLHVQHWNDAQSVLGKSHVSHEQVSYEVHLDFANGIARLESDHEVMKSLNSEGRVNRLEFETDPVFIPILVTVTSHGGVVRAKEILMNRLYDVFLIMNLSVPGSFDLYSATLHSGRGAATALRLSNYVFDMARVNSLEGRPFSPGLVDLEKTKRWYETVRSGIRQLPQNPTEKCLFSLLNLASGDISASTSAWIFYALEALLQTSPGQNLNAIRDRIALILGLADSGRGGLQRGLRNVYDVRSSFVHGGMAIAHPLQHDGIDGEVDNFIKKQLAASDFGCSLIITMLQQLIRSDIMHPKFKEIMLTDFKL